MKAYSVEIPSDDDVGQEIVWAENTKQARAMAHCTGIADYAESFIDFRVRRCPIYDDMEKLSKSEFAWEEHKEGCLWLDYDELNDENLSKDEFIRRYKSIFDCGVSE